MIEFIYRIGRRWITTSFTLIAFKKALKDMLSGEVVKVIATDPVSHLGLGVYSGQASTRWYS